VDDVLLVSEAQLLPAIRDLQLEEHVVAEPAGAAVTAALLQPSGSFDENIVLIVSRSNISPVVLPQAIC